MTRLIPARAGKTRPGGASRPGRTAHPRSRGENVAWACTSPTEAGSSPLARGKRGGEGGCGFVEGLIPARAGKTATALSTDSPLAAHPRSRGENPISVLSA